MKAQVSALLVLGLGPVALAAFPNSTGVGVPRPAPPAGVSVVVTQHPSGHVPSAPPPPTCAFPGTPSGSGSLSLRVTPRRLTLDASGEGHFTVQTTRPGRVWFVLPGGLTLEQQEQGQGGRFRLRNQGLAAGEHTVLVCAAGNGGGQALQTLAVQVLLAPGRPSEWVTPARLTLPPGGQASLRIRHGGQYSVGTAHGLVTVHRTVSQREATVTLLRRGLPPGEYDLPVWLRSPSGAEVRTSVRLRALP